VRAGGAVGEHRVILASEGEQIEIVHRATSRQTYAAGALRAAAWLARQPAGLYTMDALLSDGARVSPAV
jgi:4-hydroxy-tetrahydrodipicolinate reductase